VSECLSEQPTRAAFLEEHEWVARSGTGAVPCDHGTSNKMRAGAARVSWSSRHVTAHTPLRVRLRPRANERR
jgi:hypothetical protein